MGYDENRQRRGVEYLDALEEERRKIQVFRRDLPLCLQLVTQAIDAYRYHLHHRHHSETSPQPFDFIPIERGAVAVGVAASSSTETKDDDEYDRSGNKSDWLTSVQLWNHHSEEDPRQPLTTKKEIFPPKSPPLKNCGAFKPFHRKEINPTDASSTSRSGSARKKRRCWSPELNRQFLDALVQMGGAHVATPKQIKEVMKVEGLTNDEVKSHLQKHRLYTRSCVGNNGGKKSEGLQMNITVETKQVKTEKCDE